MEVQHLHLEVAFMGKVLEKVLEARVALTSEATQAKVGQYMVRSAGSGTMEIVPLGIVVSVGMCARLVLSQES